MNRYITLLLVAAVIFLLGGYVSYRFVSSKQPTATEQSTVLLEQIDEVFKLITVEGYFNEIYDYKDYWQYDWSPFQKKALIRVKAKVSVGYDMSQSKIDMLPEKKLITIAAPNTPTILSIDHELDYYDITEGTFNSFTPEDYNRMNKNAKEFVRKRALESNLMSVAAKQQNKAFDMIKSMATVAGWQVQIIPIASTGNTIKQ
ncbi:MAG: DUF4230 domain-containing protein [Saprospiraceae bacterium]|nr:DUF4230 domain-containing protein [Saprospiraceae bacterium]MBP7699216.1 DUF4230 domain-containing protein [Saprospiraceae bacterium]